MNNNINKCFMYLETDGAVLEVIVCGTPIVTTTNGNKFDWIHNKVGIVVDSDQDQIRSN